MRCNEYFLQIPWRQSQHAEKLRMEKEQISKIGNGKFNFMLSTINKITTALGAKVKFELQQS